MIHTVPFNARFVLLIAFVAAATPAFATFHLWNIVEVFSNADGTIQFVELETSSGFQHLLSGHEFTSNENTFEFGGNLDNSATGGRKFLMATESYVELPGAVAPDYIIEDNFFSVNGDRLSLVGADSFTFTMAELPVDGVMSLNRDRTTATNSPTNFAGETGSVRAGGNQGAEELCDVLAGIDTLLPAFRDAFGLISDDIGATGLPDRFAAALVEAGGCDNAAGLEAATQAAYVGNLAALMTVSAGTLLDGHEPIAALLLLLSSATQEAVIDLLESNDVALGALIFVVVSCHGGECSPAAAGSKQEGEPYASEGDFDGDGESNQTEFDNVTAGGGALQAFVDAATDPTLDGSEFDVPQGGCGAGANRRTQASGVLVVLLAAAVLALVRVRTPN